jgi:hypothetical protein
MKAPDIKNSNRPTKAEPLEALAQNVDKNQALLHLSLLGLQPNETFVRAFLPNAGDGGRKADSLKISQLAAWSQEERGIYLVVNGGGHRDSDIKYGRAIFYEHDNIPKAEQKILWQKLGLPEPTFQIDTGGKSIHSYWVFVTLIAIEKWRTLQRDLLEFADADRSIKNPSRVMRLAGFVHPKTQEMSQIISNSGKRYTFESLREIIPAPNEEAPLLNPTTPKVERSQANRYENITLPVPLEDCLACNSRDLLENGAGEGSRNDSAAKLARDLIGTASYLQSIGQDFSGDPQNLLGDFAQRCNPPLPQRELDLVWKSAQRSNPTPSCRPDDISNCIKAWYSKTSVKSDRNQTNYQTVGTTALKPQTNVLTHPTAQRLSEEELQNELKKLIEDDPKKSEVSRRLNSLANRTERRDLNAVKEQYQVLKQEDQAETEKPEQKQNLKEIARLRKSTLNPLDYLIGDNGKLARQLMETAEAMPTSASWLFTTLIAASASCIKAESKIMIHPKSGYKQSAIFRTLIIGNTGAKKTPAQGEILDPLMLLEIEAHKKYKEEKLQYDEELQQYEGKPKKDRTDEPPRPPIEKRYILGDTTAEKLTKIHNENPDGFLIYRDEAAGFYKGLNKYRGGAGDDLELDLSEFNGKPLIVDRVSGSSFVANPHVCRTGSTQPKVFKDLMGSFDDAAGYWARWLIDMSPAPLSLIDLFDNSETGLAETLTQLYQALANQEANIYGLSMEAKPIWQEYQHELTRRQIETNLTGLQNVYPKLETYFGRLCLWLHLVNAALAGVKPEPQICADTVSRAIKLTNYYAHQWILFHTTQNPEVSSLTAQMLAIHEFAKRKGKPVTPRQLSSGVWEFKKSKVSQVQVKEWCEVLGNTPGYGTWDGQNYFVNPAEECGGMRRKCGGLEMPVTHTVVESHKNAEVAEDFSQVLKISNSTNHVSNGILEKDVYIENPPQPPHFSEVLNPQGFEAAEDSPQTSAFLRIPPQENEKAISDNALMPSQTELGDGSELNKMEVEAIKLMEGAIAQNDPGLQTPSELNETELGVITLIEEAIALGETENAKDIWNLLGKVCEKGSANRDKIWDALGTSKQKAFLTLLIVEGAKVQYIGDRPNCKKYRGQVLIVETVTRYDGVTCRDSSGILTVWIPIEELVLVQD